ncbi:MAG: hypothetical protein LBF08_08200 [Dysgonamonadaceae bacterium]|jgi:hypothetical protein|nr:hypothetical protein [Dysgonamonadaceae bacterium]
MKRNVLLLLVTVLFPFGTIQGEYEYAGLSFYYDGEQISSHGTAPSTRPISPGKTLRISVTSPISGKKLHWYQFNYQNTSGADVSYSKKSFELEIVIPNFQGISITPQQGVIARSYTEIRNENTGTDLPITIHGDHAEDIKNMPDDDFFDPAERAANLDSYYAGYIEPSYGGPRPLSFEVSAKEDCEANYTWTFGSTTHTSTVNVWNLGEYYLGATTSIACQASYKYYIRTTKTGNYDNDVTVQTFIKNGTTYTPVASNTTAYDPSGDLIVRFTNSTIDKYRFTVSVNGVSKTTTSNKTNTQVEYNLGAFDETKNINVLAEVDPNKVLANFTVDRGAGVTGSLNTQICIGTGEYPNNSYVSRADAITFRVHGTTQEVPNYWYTWYRNGVKVDAGLNKNTYIVNGRGDISGYSVKLEAYGEFTFALNNNTVESLAGIDTFQTVGNRYYYKPAGLRNLTVAVKPSERVTYQTAAFYNWSISGLVNEQSGTRNFTYSSTDGAFRNTFVDEITELAVRSTPLVPFNLNSNTLTSSVSYSGKVLTAANTLIDDTNIPIARNQLIVPGGTVTITTDYNGSRVIVNYRGEPINIPAGTYYTVSYPENVLFAHDNNANDLGNHIPDDIRLLSGVRNFTFTAPEEIDGNTVAEYYWTYTDATGVHTDTATDNILTLENYNLHSSLEVRVNYRLTYTLNVVKSSVVSDDVQIRTYIRNDGTDVLVNNQDTLLPGGQVVIKCSSPQLRKYAITVNNAPVTILSDTVGEYVVGDFNRNISASVNIRLSPRTDVAGYRYETTDGVFDVTGDTTTVPHLIDSIKLYPVVSDENPFIIYDTLSASLSVGANTIRLTVTAPDGVTQRDTAFTVFRRLNPDFSIAGFIVHAIDPVFRDTLTFTDTTDINFAYEYSILHFEIIPKDNNLYVTADNGYYPIEGSGEGSRSFTIYAEDTEFTDSRTITYNRLPPKSDTSIEGILVNNRLFTGDTIEYEVPYETVRITVAGKKKADNQHVTFTGVGGLNLNRGMNEFNIRVIAQDGETERIIKLKIFRQLFSLNNTAVENILIDTVAFPDGNVNYATPYEHDTVTIAVRKLIDNFVTVTGEGTYPLQPGDNEFKLLITAQSGVKREISVNIRRKPTSDISTEIESITVAGNDTVFVFRSFPVHLSVPFHLSTVRINAQLSDVSKGASVLGESTYRLAIGRNEFKIKVTSADLSNHQEYDIFISRLSSFYEVKRMSYTPNIYGYSELDLSRLYHEITMPYTVEKINFLVEKDPLNENVTVTGDSAHDLRFGVNEFDIVVTAEYGIPKIYKITVNRQEDPTEPTKPEEPTEPGEPTGINHPNSEEPDIYRGGDYLYNPSHEDIMVYGVSGGLLYKGNEAIIRIPKGILIVKGRAGWILKI